MREVEAGDLAALCDRGPFFAFTQGDACPDNCIRVEGAPRLLDFEGAVLFRGSAAPDPAGRVEPRASATR